jgi:uncharacterized protein
MLSAMRRFVFQVMAVATGLFALPAHAQTLRETGGIGTVMILTDGLAEPNGRGTRAVNELAERLAQQGKLRVLPVAGLGAAANARELLYQGGADFAILNSDILAYLEDDRQYSETRIRYVTRLFDQQVYLLVRKQLNAIKDLRGGKLVVLSPGSGSHTTATTLFRLLKIDVTLKALGPDAVLDDAGLKLSDGVLLLSDELSRLRLSAQMRQDLHLLPIPMTQALHYAYVPAVIEAPEFAGRGEAGQLDTIAVSTLLAVYDWKPTHSRYAYVTNFISALHSTVLDFHHQSTGSIWLQLDSNARIPGWTKYAPAEPNRVLPTPAVEQLPSALLPGLAAIQKPKIRLLATGWAPLADERSPDGGLIVALVNSSLDKAEWAGSAHTEIDVRWTKAALPPIQSLLSDPTIDISLPWESADCERPNDLAQASAVLCDNALYTDPILQVVIGLFTVAESTFTFDTDESIFGKTICLPYDRDTSALNGNGRYWLSEKRIVVVWQPTLIDCISSVQLHEADAFVANDLEGRYVLRRLGLVQLFKMAERPLETRGVHAIVARNHIQASELIGAVNRGLKELKQSDAYAAIVRQHLMQLWDTRVGPP